MITVAVRVAGDRFERLSAEQAAAVARARLQTAFAVEADWKSDVRVDTGTYRRSIHTADGAAESVVSSDIHYALYNEFGTSRGMVARPSATKAAEVQRRAYPDRVARALRGVA